MYKRARAHTHTHTHIHTHAHTQGESGRRRDRQARNKDHRGHPLACSSSAGLSPCLPSLWLHLSLSPFLPLPPTPPSRRSLSLPPFSFLPLSLSRSLTHLSASGTLCGHDMLAHAGAPQPPRQSSLNTRPTDRLFCTQRTVVRDTADTWAVEPETHTLHS